MLKIVNFNKKNFLNKLEDILNKRKLNYIKKICKKIFKIQLKKVIYDHKTFIL